VNPRKRSRSCGGEVYPGRSAPRSRRPRFDVVAIIWPPTPYGTAAIIGIDMRFTAIVDLVVSFVDDDSHCHLKRWRRGSKIGAGAGARSSAGVKRSEYEQHQRCGCGGLHCAVKAAYECAARLAFNTLITWGRGFCGCVPQLAGVQGESAVVAIGRDRA